MKRRIQVVVITMSMLGALPLTAAACPNDMQHLSGMLPSYNEPELRKLRSDAIAMNVRQVMNSATGMGYSPQAAVDAVNQQVAEFERTMQSAEACLRKSDNRSGDGLVASLRDGSYPFGNTSQPNVNQSCAKAYAAQYIGVISNREMAKVMACHWKL